MKLEILTPEKQIFEGDVQLVQLPGIDGFFEVLENHAPLVAALAKGSIKTEAKIDNKVETLHFEIKGGTVEVLQNKVLILAE